ncbi:F-box domain-containing protein [Mycena indigotica]|uniref:F-box domain-containing protein n=1 Tax=Mycena indigotica TaxID=2126181 RepID=A0A8H6W1J7_9AGAR|nr:F-box domain-containing protein [Mycena indigotica]KAF7302144.1 F-box domain-containing protein [Mycena indigotica]
MALVQQALQAAPNNQFIPLPTTPLPNEIMAEIFAHCVPGDAKINLLDPSECPLLLLRICRTWRNLALSTPVLWSTLSFDLECIDSVEERINDISLVVDTWLARARRRPLIVGIAGLWSAGSALGGLRTILRPLSKTIHKHSPNITRLIWRLAHASEADFFIPYPMNWARLIELELVPPDLYGEVESDDAPVEIFANAPLLRKISITRVQAEAFDLPLAQLTHLRQECVYAHQCLPILSALPKLIQCHLYSVDRELEQDLLLSIKTYPSIKHLSLTENQWIAVHSPTLSKNILGFMTLPALESLDLAGADRIDADLLVAFLKRSSPPLRRLAFHPIETLQLNSIKPFHLLPSLEELEIHRPSRHLIVGFCQELAFNTVLPRLRRLIIHSHSSVDEMDFIADQVGHALLARGKLVNLPPLDLLRLIVPVDFGETNLAKMSSALVTLAGLKEHGMNVYLGTDELSAI